MGMDMVSGLRDALGVVLDDDEEDNALLETDEDTDRADAVERAFGFETGATGALSAAEFRAELRMPSDDDAREPGLRVGDAEASRHNGERAELVATDEDTARLPTPFALDAAPYGPGLGADWWCSALPLSERACGLAPARGADRMSNCL